MAALMGTLLAGLGLFFVGASLLDRHLRALAGRRLRTVFAGLTDRPGKAAWWGFCVGAVAQTASAVTYLTISLVNTGLLSARRALTALNWSNPGTCVLVFFLTLPLDVFTAYVVGLAGILHAFEKPRRWRHAAGFVFGMGLLFYGLLMMQDTGEQLRDYGWFRDLLAGASGRYALVFLVGTLLTVLAQSGNAVVLVTIALAGGGLLGEDEAIMAIYGVNLGASLITHLLTLRLEGTAKQMAMFQVAYGWLGTAILVPLFYLETVGGIPLVLAGLDLTGLPLEQRLALANLVWCLLASLGAWALENPAARWLESRYPQGVHEADDRPRYLYPRCEEDPETCLQLVDLEHRRLVRRLERYFRLPSGAGGNAAASALGLHQDYGRLRGEIDQVLRSLMDRRLGGEAAGQLTRALEVQDLLGALENEFFQTLPRARSQLTREDSLSARALEGLEAAWLTAADAFVERGADDIELAERITADGGGALSRLREALLDPDARRDTEERREALRLLSGCERLVWLANRLLSAL